MLGFFFFWTAVRNSGIAVEVGSRIPKVSASLLTTGTVVGRAVAVEEFAISGEGDPPTTGEVSLADTEAESSVEVAALGAASSEFGVSLGGAGSPVLGVSVGGADSSVLGAFGVVVRPRIVQEGFETLSPSVEGDAVAAASLAASEAPASEVFDRLRVVMVIRCRFVW